MHEARFMPCCLGLLALSAPRVVIVLVVFFSDYIGRAYATVLWPLLGFIFAPTTTLAYAFAMHNGGARGLYLALIVIAVLIDLGSSGYGLSRRRDVER
jgi:hypothetical protein